jgi:hypothetical protein
VPGKSADSGTNPALVRLTVGISGSSRGGPGDQESFSDAPTRAGASRLEPASTFTSPADLLGCGSEVFLFLRDMVIAAGRLWA